MRVDWYGVPVRFDKATGAPAPRQAWWAMELRLEVNDDATTPPAE